MGWFLQTPTVDSPKLLRSILDQCGPAQKGGAAFAFATAQGVKLLAAEAEFSNFLKASEFEIIVGLDAITDTQAVDELRKVNKKHPNFKPKLFLHSTVGSLFHPKTMWLKTPKGGVIITGSGNLTTGGLKSNWEAIAVETLDAAAMAEAEKNWNAWLNAHAKLLLDLDDPKVAAKAEANKKLKVKIKKVIRAPEEEVDDIDPDVEALGDLMNPLIFAGLEKV